MTDQELPSDHLEDGKEIPQTLETISLRQPKTSDHATVDHHTQDSPVQLKLLRFQLVLLPFQLDNKSHSVTVQLVCPTSDQELRSLLMVLLTLTERLSKSSTSRLHHFDLIDLLSHLFPMILR